MRISVGTPSLNALKRYPFGSSRSCRACRAGERSVTRQNLRRHRRIALRLSALPIEAARMLHQLAKPYAAVSSTCCSGITRLAGKRRRTVVPVPGERQSEPRPPVSPGEAALDLPKWRERNGDLLIRHADAGVADRDGDLAIA